MDGSVINLHNQVMRWLGLLVFAVTLSAETASAQPGVPQSSPVPSPTSSTAPPESMAEVTDEIERDYLLKSSGEVQITNTRGDIVVRGWALDKIRVRARRRVSASTEDEARRLFQALDFRFASAPGVIEVLAEYGRGLPIEERLRERARPRASMEMEVWAPSSARLRVWAMNGKVSLQGWRAPVEVRTAEGPIRLENVRGSSLSLLCPSCSIDARSLEGSLRCMGGSGQIQLRDVSGPQIYVESTSGSLEVENVRAERQLYVTKTANIRVQRTTGHVEFHSQHGSVEVLDADGFLSGRTDSGDILARMRSWRFDDKALLESVRGRIDLTLPSDFSGDLDAWSLYGTLEVGFPLRARDEGLNYGPQPLHRKAGRVAEGGETFRLYSEKGDIRIIRGPRG